MTRSRRFGPSATSSATGSCAPWPMPRMPASGPSATAGRRSNMAAPSSPATCCRSMTISAVRSKPPPRSSAKQSAALIEGVELTMRELLNVFSKHGITLVKPEVGDKFDPQIHQAMFEAPGAQHRGRRHHPGHDRRVPAQRSCQGQVREDTSLRASLRVPWNTENAPCSV